MNPATTTDEIAVDERCPKCSARLIAPELMGYCPACGFCRYIERERAEVRAPVPRRPSPLREGLRILGEQFAGMPGWITVLIGGSISILLYLLAIDPMLDSNPHLRAVLGLTLMAGGVLVYLLAQLWAMLKVVAEHPTMSFWDIYLAPGQIWHLAIRQLPETRWPVWLAGWAVTAALGGWLIVGGQDYWFIEPPVEDEDETELVAEP